MDKKEYTQALKDAKFYRSRAFDSHGDVVSEYDWKQWKHFNEIVFTYRKEEIKKKKLLRYAEKHGYAVTYYKES